MLAAGIYFVFSEKIYWGILLIVIAIALVTTRYTTVVDKDRKTYSDYLQVFGLRLLPDYGNFQFLDKIVITKGEYAYKAATRSRDRSVQFNDYSATLIFINEHKLDLLTETNKKSLLKKIKGMATYLEIPVEDQSVREPYQIDMSRI